MRELKVLIIDDHQLMIDGFKNCLRQIDCSFIIDVARDCESGSNFILAKKDYDLLLVDFSLPASDKYNTGADLAKLAEDLLPDCKIVVITSHDEAFILYDILKKNRPSALLVKSDFTAAELTSILSNVIRGQEFRSKTVLNAVKKISTQNEYLDGFNRQIISLLSQGHKSKTLSAILGLSISTVDKRKVYIKDFFGIDKGNDEDIVREARKRKLI